MREPDRRAECDFCTRKDVRIKRRYRGLRYCATCYVREFKRRPCPQCGQVARLPIDRPTAICRDCERNEPCLHCEKVDPDRGKTTAGGRICGACAQRLRQPEPCELCGTPSNRLARSSRLGHDLRVCPRCARATNGTCAACRRHRPLETAADGRLLCAPCRDEGERPCEQCGETMPAGYGRRCAGCEGAARARKRVEALGETLAPPGMGEHFRAFGEWLVETAGPEKAARDAPRYAAFFTAIGEAWGDIPDYGTLVAHFGAEGIRRRRRAIRWMDEQGLVSVDAKVREEDSERRRIAAGLGRLPEESQAQRVMVEYHGVLDKRVRTGRLTRRSMRLSLTPAVALLEAGQAAGRSLPDQGTLEALLRQAPGQRAALAGFVRWLRESHDIALALPAKSKTAALRNRRRTAREEMLSLLREKPGSHDFGGRWRVAALTYFHDLTLKAAQKVQDEDIESELDGLRINVGGEGYWIPVPPKAQAERTPS